MFATILGPLYSSGGVHACLAPRLWDHCLSDDMSDGSSHPECYNQCVSLRQPVLGAANIMTSPLHVDPIIDSALQSVFATNAPAPIISSTSATISAITPSIASNSTAAIEVSLTSRSSTPLQDCYLFRKFQLEASLYLHTLDEDDELQIQVSTEKQAGETLFSIIFSITNNLPLL